MAVRVRQHMLRLRGAIEDGSWGSPNSRGREQRCLLLIGSTGCGKTLLASQAARMMGIPSVVEDCSTLTATGYVGRSVSDTVSSLVVRAESHLNIARWGVIVLDEIDKLAQRDGNRSTEVSRGEVQRQLLSLLEGSSVQTEFPPSGPREARAWLPFPTADTLVVLCGAFEGLDQVVSRRLGVGKSKIGFGSSSAPDGIVERQRLLRQACAEDLVQYGLIPEFVGRIGQIVHLSDLTHEHLKQILLSAPEGPLALQQRLAARERFSIRITDALADAIVKEALTRGLGARSLAAIMCGVTTRMHFEVPSKINPLDEGTYTTELDVTALVDGSYKLTHRRGKLSKAKQQKIIDDVVRLSGKQRDDPTDAAVSG